MVVAYTGRLRIVSAVTCTRRIQIGEGVEPGVIAERPFRHQRLRGVDVPLDHELRFRRHLEIARHRLRQAHRRPPQKAREQELIDGGWQRRGRGVHRRRVGANGDAHGHRLPSLGHLAPVRRAHLVPLPVHREVARA